MICRKQNPNPNGCGNGADIVQKNELAIQILWRCELVLFGNYLWDIPYSESLDITNPFPKYDDAKTIYNDLLTRLDADIGKLKTTAESFGGADIIYEGNVTAWKKFANSLKLKMGMTIADADNAKAKSTIESAVAAGVFTSNADNCSSSTTWELHQILIPSGLTLFKVDAKILLLAAQL